MNIFQLRLFPLVYLAAAQSLACARRLSEYTIVIYRTLMCFIRVTIHLIYLRYIVFPAIIKRKKPLIPAPKNKMPV